jgi:hypothetical protein
MTSYLNGIFLFFVLCNTSKDGKQYYLASAKLNHNKQGGHMHFAQEKTIELMYIHKEGLQEELEKLCCFGSLKAEKVVARLGKNIRLSL